MITFALTENGKTSTLRITDDVITIGRSRECRIVVRNIKASRQHAKIEPVGGVYQISDLGSGNGTRLNGLKITFENLKVGDEIRVGDAVLVLKAIDSEVKVDEADGEADPAATDLGDVSEKETEIRLLEDEPPAKPAPKAAPARPAARPGAKPAPRPLPRKK